MSAPIISRLVKDLKPVTVVPVRPLAAIFGILLVTYAGLFALIAFGWREDWTTHFTRPLQVALLVTLVGLLVSSLFCIVRISIPGTKIPPVLKLLPLGFFLIFNVLLLMVKMPPGATMGQGLAMEGWRCTGALILIALVPAVITFFLVRHLAPLESRQTAQWVGYLVCAVGALGLSLHCPVDHFLHLFVYHSLPIVVITVAMPLLASRLLRW